MFSLRIRNSNFILKRYLKMEDNVAAKNRQSADKPEEITFKKKPKDDIPKLKKLKNL